MTISHPLFPDITAGANLDASVRSNSFKSQIPRNKYAAAAFPCLGHVHAQFSCSLKLFDVFAAKQSLAVLNVWLATLNMQLLQFAALRMQLVAC